MENRQAIIAWVSQLVKDLVETPEDLSFKATVDEKGLLITVYAPKQELGGLIGKQGRIAEALRTIVNIYGSKKNARVALKIDDAGR